MKRLVLKKGIQNIVIGVAIASLLVLASDCKDLTTFIITHATSLLTFCLSTYILYKYTNLIEREF